MKLTDKQCEDNSHISTDEVQQDLNETKYELEQFEAELNVFINDRVKNKVPIYFAEGNISKRKDLISTLESILSYRNVSYE